MKVTLIFASASAGANYAPGSILEVSEDEGRDMIKRRLAREAPADSRVTLSVQEQARHKTSDHRAEPAWVLEAKKRKAAP